MTILQIPFFQTQPSSELIFTTTGISTFTVPDDVRHISAVCVGAGGGGGNGGSNAETPGGAGGALAWVSNLPVSPGESLTINVGSGGAGGATGAAGSSYIARGSTILMTAFGGGNGGTTANAGATSGGTFTFGTGVVGDTGIGTGGGNGGAGGGSANTSSGGGGGTGGYSGTGGAGGTGSAAYVDGTAGSGGAGGGGESANSGNNQGAGGGGGVGLLGEGSNGTGGTGNTADFGDGGSGGSNGTIGGANAGGGGLYGGGAGGSSGAAAAAAGANGAVRIVWGPGKIFPGSQSVTFFTADISGSSSISIPSNISPGDVAVLFDYAAASASPLPTGEAYSEGVTPLAVFPTGWTTIANLAPASQGVRNVSSYKILTSSDINGVVTGMTGVYMQKSIIVFRPNFNINSVQIGDYAGEVSLSNPTSQVLNISGITTTPLIALCHMASNSEIITRSVTGDTFSEFSNKFNQFVEYKVYNTPSSISSNITFDIDDYGDNGIESFYITFT